MDAHIPVFRVFVSSTFADFVEERRTLQDGAFARLAKYCAERGARFQAIDLRWGIDQRAANDQQSLVICLRELARCLDPLPKPNFVILLGERYGWRPLPPSIDQSTFETLREAAPTADRPRLERWYGLDRNAVPPVYVLQPRTGRFESPRPWEHEEATLRQTLLTAARSRGWTDDDPRVQQLVRSATHHEIAAGALSDEAPSDGVFAYVRHSEGSPPRRAAYRPYVESPEQVEKLEAELREVLSPDHVYDYAIEWPRWFWSTPHIDLDALDQRVEADLRGAIDREVAAIERLEPSEREEAAHEAFREQRARGLVGREAPLSAIEGYLGAEAADRPCFVIGESGSGKSALMARAATDCASREGITVVRFVSVTPASSTLRGLLSDLCRQLAIHVGRTHYEPPEASVPLRESFHELLDAVRQRTKLYLFVDAIDQLDPTDAPETLAWLPSPVPEGVRIVVSVLERPDDDDASRAAENAREHYLPEAFVEVLPLAAEHGATILDAGLAAARRTLTEAQRTRVLDGFAENGLPLYLRIALEQAVRWSSREEVEELPNTIRGLVNRFFDGLEAEHEAGVVAVVLGNLAAARHGLSETEILDLLAENESWFGGFRRSALHDLPEGNRRVPVIVWARLLGDLERYLTERLADGTQLHTFYHRQIAEAAADRYRTLDNHTALADHFLREPTWFAPRGGPRRPNQRKVSELPSQLRAADRFEELITLLADPDFADASIALGQRYAWLLDVQDAYLASAGLAETWRTRLCEAVLSASLDPNRADGVDATYVHEVLVYQADRSFYRALLDHAARADVEGSAIRPFRIGLANLLRREGELARAQPIFEQVLVELRDQTEPDPGLLSRTLYEAGYVNYLRGDFARGVELLRESADAAGPDRPISAWVSRCVATATAVRGGLTSADELLAVAAEARPHFEAQASTNAMAERWVMNTHVHELEVYLDRGDVEQARTKFGTVSRLKWFQEFDREELLDRLRGMLRSLEGRHVAAKEAFGRFLKSFGDTPEDRIESHARHLLEWSRILARAGDADESRAALRSAASLPGEPGNHAWIEVARRELTAET